MSKAKKIMEEFANSPTLTSLETMETLVAYARGLELAINENAPTLRDQFAMAAMTGFNKGMVDYGWGKDVLSGHAKQAYAIADAMLQARKLKSVLA